MHDEVEGQSDAESGQNVAGMLFAVLVLAFDLYLWIGLIAWNVAGISNVGAGDPRTALLIALMVLPPAAFGLSQHAARESADAKATRLIVAGFTTMLVLFGALAVRGFMAGGF